MKEGDIYFYNARWYDPQLGRFMQADTIVPTVQGTQGFDRYAYVNNSPMRYTDPTGHCPLLWFQLVRWSIVGAGAFFMNTTKEIIVQNNDAMNQQERDRIGGALVTELSEIINDEANRNNISADLIGAVIRHESGAFERRIFGPFANVAEAGEATFRNLFNKGSASIGIGQMQVATAKMLEENGYVNYGGNTISNLLDPEKAVGYVAGYLSYLDDNLSGHADYRNLSYENRQRALLEGYNQGLDSILHFKDNFMELIRRYGYHKQTLDRYNHWKVNRE